MAERRDYRSAEAAAYRRLYQATRWKKLRADHLSTEPLCRMCLAAGRYNDGRYRMTGELQANPRRRFLVCDHIKPHRGDETLFFAGPFQTLCTDHHDITKQQFETRGYGGEVDADGWPTDERHPANKVRA